MTEDCGNPWPSQRMMIQQLFRLRQHLMRALQELGNPKILKQLDDRLYCTPLVVLRCECREELLSGCGVLCEPNKAAKGFKNTLRGAQNFASQITVGFGEDARRSSFRGLRGLAGGSVRGLEVRCVM